MKKKITLLSLLMLLTSNGLCFSQTNSVISDNSDAQPVKVALGGELIREAVKSGLYSLGTALLNKYVNPSNYVYTTTSTSATTDTTSTGTTTSSQDGTTSTQDSSVTTQTTTDQPTEQMIPVS